VTRGDTASSREVEVKDLADAVAFTLGLLHARQQETAAHARTGFWPVWAEAARSRNRRWLST
jgi:hypothetical protein